MVAATYTHPFDTLKIRLQMQNKSIHTDGYAHIKKPNVYKNFVQATLVIYSNEGVKGLYKGLSASLMRESVYSTIRLGCYEPIK